MSDALSIDPKSSALLVMDLQNMMVGMLADANPLLAANAKLIDAARSKSLRVIYVVLGFRAGHPEIGATNTMFGQVKTGGLFVEGSNEAQIHSAVAPKASDLVVTKHRVGAFSGTDLELILRANQIDTLVLTGIATSGIVLSTLRHAADHDYRVVVARDCCADRDDEVHRVLMDKVFARQATVTSSEAIIAAIG
ncbi:MAG TPA: isochorismatase family cysteine hydrolase [Polyangiaceae bacterium]|jgi:nicotinamidase-related amidase|nr:isochorismatase family cysteine hydrolase [Polyangiaceae bacterium]